MIVLVTGASGFVGRHAVSALRSRGHDVRALVRSSRGSEALSNAGCEIVLGDVTDPESLAAATNGVDAVVHLVAIIAGRPRDFERVMVSGTANLIKAARAADVGRFVYVSALGTNEQTRTTVPYYAAKWDCEEAVISSGLPHTILRPSFVFGGDGGALPRFIRIARLAPVTPIVGAGTQRIQPIWVDDVAEAVALATVATGDGTVEIGGPDVLDWNGLWAAIKTAIGTRRPALHIPAALIRPAALLLEFLPDPPVTRDQLTMLRLGDNIVSDDGESMAALGLSDCIPLEEQLRRAVAPPH